MLYQKMKKYKMNSEGFTLLELMTVIAIIGILASAIMVSLSVQKKRAVVGRVLTEMSATMQNIYLCKSDDGTINSPDPTGGNDLCGIDPNYGQWPDVSEDALGEGMNFDLRMTGEFDSSSWAYWADPQGSGISGAEMVCCNSKSGKCGKIDSGSVCGTDTVIK